MANFLVLTEETTKCWNRFVSPDIQKKYDLWLPDYDGIDQVVEVGSNGQKL